MKKLNMFLLAAMLLLMLFWVGPARASSVYFESFTTGIPPEYVDANTYQLFASGSGTSGAALTYTPVAAGLFSQKTSFNISMSVTVLPIGTGISGFFPYQPPDTDIIYYIDLDQSNPFRFTDLNWKVTSLQDGIETTIFDLSADAGFLASGGTTGGGVTFDFGTLSVPIGETGETFEFVFNIYQTGNVVPVPPSLLMLGSSLLGLAGWRQLRKG